MNTDCRTKRCGTAAAIWEATHPRAVIVFSGLSWAVAAMVVRGLPAIGIGLLIVAAMALVQVAIGLFNEYCDRDLDRWAKPDRAVPRGVLGYRQACVAAWVSLATGLACAAVLSLWGAAVLAVGGGMGMVYSARLKRTVWSWLPYAVAYPIVPLWVWVTLGVFRAELLLIYPLVVPFAVGVHLCNQLRDYDADLAQGMRGVVQWLGQRTAGKLCWGLLTVMPLLALAGWGWQGRGGLVLAGTALHGVLLGECWVRYGRTDDDRLWPKLFQRLQISGPVLLISVTAVLSP
jgi:4-hydroxybenzoate polyprenyltransferase